MPNYVTLDDAQRALANAARILVIGCSGGGKTTLALRLADQFDLAYQSIDRDVRWLPGWHLRERAEQRQILGRLVDRPRWVMDGSGASTFDIRVPRADLIIWVRVPRRVALWGILHRGVQNFGRVRPAMADGCPERFPDRDFLSYIWNFERDHAPQFAQQIDRFGPDVPVVVLRSHRDAAQLLGDG